MGLINAFLFGVWFIYCWWKKICTTYFSILGHHCGARFLPSTIIGKHQLCQCVFAGYSSGSAGGTVFPEPAGASDSPEAPNTTEVTAEVPAPTEEANEPKDKPPDPSLAEHEAALKERLEQHMKMLEDKFYNELLDRKRAAEQDLEIEIESKRQKKLREIDDEFQDDKTQKQACLDQMEAQLMEKMQLVADEQTVLDELREKSRTVRQQLEEAAKQDALLPPPPSTPSPASGGESSAMKERLRQKLLEATSKKPAVTQGPTAPPKPEVSGLPDKPKGDIVVPISNTRFTSSTHPEAWHFLYRINKKVDDKDSLPEWQKEVYEQWHAGLSAPNF